MQPSEQIKSKLDIVDVIKEYIRLQSAGVNFRALCPFHREKSPSFIVSPEKQIWHCFGCGKGGDIFSFVMEHEGINFVEALRLLAPKAGVTLKRTDPKMVSRRNRLLDLTDLAKRYYYEVLLNSRLAEPARKYLAERGLNQSAIDDWQIGFAPDSWNDLIDFLKSRGFSDNEIASAGLSIQKQGTNRFYNRFRDRIMFPIDDINGNTVGFSGRISPDKEAEEKMGKYINSPQTEIYDKSEILFGLNRAKQAIKREGFAVVVEGQMDVITAHLAGFKNTVAQSGTALTADSADAPKYLQKSQINLLKRFTENIYLAFDSDNAGQTAVERAENAIFNNLLSEDVNIKVVKIPFGKDPDEAIKKDPEIWKNALKEAKGLMNYHFDKIISEVNLDTIEGKQSAAKKILAKISRISGKIRQDYWIKRLSEAINIDENALREALRQARQSKKSPNKKTDVEEGPSIKRAKTRPEILSEALLVLILKFPELVSAVENSLGVENIFGEDNKEFYKKIIIYYNSKDRVPDYSDFRNWLESEEKNSFDEKRSLLSFCEILAILGERDFYHFDFDKAKNEILKIIKELKFFYRSERKRELGALLKKAEEEKNEEQIIYLMGELNNLNKDA